MDNLSRFENVEFPDETDAIILHIISENEINPLDPDTPVNNGKGRYVLLKKKRSEEDGDPDYKEVFDAGGADISEAENESKTEYNMQKQRESIKQACSFFLDNLEIEKAENIKYSNPIRMGYGSDEHVVYQRIILKNQGGTKNAYEFIKEKLERNGIEVGIVNATFEGMRVKYIASVDGKGENMSYGEQGVKYRNPDMHGDEKNASWEVLVDGRFLSESIDKSVVGRNSVIEIRRKSGCGGGGNYDPLLAQNDPTINKSRLPSFMQVSGYRNQSWGSHYMQTQII